MNLPRRQFLHLAAGAVAAPAVARRAFADAYPSRPVRLIVGFTPAGGNDIVARLMGQWLTERLGQTFVIENPSSSPTPRPIRAGSTWGRPASAARAISPANFSR